MDGFKNTTKTQYSMGGSAKFGKVMREFKAGTLHSGSKKGPAVTNPKQAFAIAASEARNAPMKKQAGGEVRSTLTQAERNARDWKQDLRDSEHRAVDKLGYSFNGVKVYPGDKVPSKAEREDGGRAIKRLNRLGFAYRGFDAETGEGMDRPLKYNDDGRPLARAEGGPISRKTGTRTDPEYGDFVAAGAAKPSAMAVKKPVPMVKKPVPMASTKKPMPRAMFGDEAAAAMDRSGKAGMTAAEKREGYNMGGKTSVDAKVDWASGFPRVGVRSGIHKTVESRASASRSGPAMRDGVVVPNASYKPSTEDISDYMRQSSTKAGRERLKRDAAGDKMLQKETLRRIRSGEDESPDAYKKGGRAKGPKVMAEKMVATKRTATPTMNAQEMRTMQRYRAAMASRPRREPMIGGDMGGDQIGPAIRQMAMAPEAPPTMGMRKGGYSGMKMRKGGTPC